MTICFIFHIFSGAVIGIKEINTFSIVVRWIPYLSIQRWAVEAQYLIEIRKYKSQYDISFSLDRFGYNENDLSFCLWYLPILGVVYRCLALAALRIIKLRKT